MKNRKIGNESKSGELDGRMERKKCREKGKGGESGGKEVQERGKRSRAGGR